MKTLTIRMINLLVDKSNRPRRRRGGKWKDWIDRKFKVAKDYLKRRSKRQLGKKDSRSSQQYRKKIFDGKKDNKRYQNTTCM